MASTCESSTDLLTALQAHFGHKTFKAGQQQVITTVLAGQDVLAVMPTGSGKSLGYQLPAVMLEGTTLVVSPLISLMKDQVDELTRRGIPAAALHSMLAPPANEDGTPYARRYYTALQEHPDAIIAHRQVTTVLKKHPVRETLH
jgi:ATP-dependent DNA helicase RecQ